jgi:alpha-beta hydrolase superfamily lysophospholipase
MEISCNYFILCNMLHRYSIILLWLVFASCSFNKMFLKPDKLSSKITKVQFIEPKGDTVILSFNNNYYTGFTDTKNRPIDVGYKIKEATIMSKDGNKLYGWFIKPSGITTPAITILFLHGNGGNVLSQFQFMKPFVKLGCQILLIDYSGFGLSTGRATNKNVRSDANAALQWLKQQPGVNDTKLVIYGQSLGGHLSVTVAADNEKEIDALVTEGAFSSHKDIAAYISKLGFIARLLVKENYSAIKSIKKFHKPVLIIHSTEDKTVPFFMGKKIYALANQPKSFYEIKHQHIEGPLYYADSIYARITAMVAK